MISTHVLDTALGSPAPGLAVHFDVLEPDGAWRRLASSRTNEDGRTGALAQASDVAGRTCRLSFETAAYFAAADRPAFFPRVEVMFVAAADATRYHVPLLLSPYGYSTYRGS
jgi:5-hydroxyisourate hydrolase